MKAHWLWRIFHNSKAWFDTPPYTKGFRNLANLADHFERHKSKFPSITRQGYADAADKFCGGKIAEDTLLCFRGRDGARVMYNVNSNEFAFVDANGFIGSYYIITKPRKGLEYFKRKCSE